MISAKLLEHPTGRTDCAKCPKTTEGSDDASMMAWACSEIVTVPSSGASRNGKIAFEIRFSRAGKLSARHHSSRVLLSTARRRFP